MSVYGARLKAILAMLFIRRCRLTDIKQVCGVVQQASLSGNETKEAYIEEEEDWYELRRKKCKSTKT